MSLTSLIMAASETHSGQPAVHPYAVGAVAFALLLVMLFGVLMFGKGREHS
jgi:hypothetical protein